MQNYLKSIVKKIGNFTKTKLNGSISPSSMGTVDKNYAKKNEQANSLANFDFAKEYFAKQDMDTMFEYLSQVNIEYITSKEELLFYHSMHGHYYTLKRNPELAIDSFSSAISIDPNDANNFFCRCNEYMAIKNYSLAEKDCKKAIELMKLPFNESLYGDVLNMQLPMKLMLIKTLK